MWSSVESSSPARTPGHTPGKQASRPLSGARALKQLAVLPLQERRIVQILRACFADPALKEDDSIPGRALHTLAAEARRHGLALFAPNAAFLSIDEIGLLDRIARLQRPSQSGDWIVEGPFQSALLGCARALDEDGRRLPPRPNLADEIPGVAPCLIFRHGAEHGGGAGAPKRRRSKVKWDGVQEPAPGSIRARALAMVRRHALVKTAQFLVEGISYQHLSALHRQGYLRKAGHGIYALPESPPDHST